VFKAPPLIGRRKELLPRLSPASPRCTLFCVTHLFAAPTFARRPPLSIACLCASPAFVRRPPLRIAHLCVSAAFARRPPLRAVRLCVSSASARRPPLCVARLCASPAFALCLPFRVAHLHVSPAFSCCVTHPLALPAFACRPLPHDATRHLATFLFIKFFSHLFKFFNVSRKQFDSFSLFQHRNSTLKVNRLAQVRLLPRAFTFPEDGR
jgi:hypothetical protein